MTSCEVCRTPLLDPGTCFDCARLQSESVDARAKAEGFARVADAQRINIPFVQGHRARALAHHIAASESSSKAYFEEAYDAEQRLEQREQDGAEMAQAVAT